MHWAGSAYSDHDKKEKKKRTWRFLLQHGLAVISAASSLHWGRWFTTGAPASSQCRDVCVGLMIGGWIIRSWRVGRLDSWIRLPQAAATQSAGEAAIEKGWKIDWRTSLSRKRTNALKWSQGTICYTSWWIFISCTWSHVKVIPQWWTIECPRAHTTFTEEKHPQTFKCHL